jgi:superfamily I DNA/RNA helicase
MDSLKNITASKHKLTKNLRNTQDINNWITTMIPSVHLKPSINGGMPVRYFSWKTQQEEKKQVGDEIGRLVSQGIQPRKIVILSPHIKEKSSFAGVDKLKEWKLGETIRFETIRSFKGLEADIVFLTGIRAGSKVCTDADVYVGGSRARFLLYVFHEDGWKN